MTTPTVKAGEVLRAFFPGETMWVKCLLQDGEYMVATLENTPVVTIAKEAQDRGEEIDPWLSTVKPGHDLTLHGERVWLRWIEWHPGCWHWHYERKATAQ